MDAKSILSNPDLTGKETREAYLFRHSVRYSQEHDTFNYTRSCQVRKNSGVTPSLLDIFSLRTNEQTTCVVPYFSIDISKRDPEEPEGS